MLTPQEVKFLQEELASAKNPLFIYDDDGDGLSSFLLLYRIHSKGKGIMIQATPKVEAKLIRRVEEIRPDKIFILDLPIVEQEFVDKANRPIFWIDHHQIQKLERVHYYNPHLKDAEAYLPTTRMAYQISQKPEDLWIATIGCLSDWYMPDFIEEFIEKYPHLISKKTDLAETVYQQPISKLVKLFFFILKGKPSEAMQAVKVLTRIQSPDEILKQETPPGKFLYKRFELINSKYEQLLEQAKKHADHSKILLFFYSDDRFSLTNTLANELITIYPKKVIIVCRKSNGEMKCSLRAKTPIEKQLQKALVGIEGYGGGHPNACGALVKEKDWERFLEQFKEELKHD